MAAAKVRLSDTALWALRVLAGNPDLRIITLRRGERPEWYARISYTDRPTYGDTVPIAVFRRMVSLGMIACEGAHVRSVSRYDGDLISTHYALTDAGRAALESAGA